MPRHLSPFRRRARQLIGRPIYYRDDPRHDGPSARPGSRSMLGIAYTGVRRPMICTGCICLTPAERTRQKRVFALVRAIARASEMPHS